MPSIEFPSPSPHGSFSFITRPQRHGGPGAIFFVLWLGCSSDACKSLQAFLLLIVSYLLFIERLLAQSQGALRMYEEMGTGAGVCGDCSLPSGWEEDKTYCRAQPCCGVCLILWIFILWSIFTTGISFFFSVQHLWGRKGRNYYLEHHDEENEAQRGEIICPRPYSLWL